MKEGTELNTGERQEGKKNSALNKGNEGDRDEELQTNYFEISSSTALTAA